MSSTIDGVRFEIDLSRRGNRRSMAGMRPWRADVCRRDAALYRARGIGHVTTFAVWIDAEHVQRHGGVGLIDEYGAILRDAGNDKESIGSERRGPSV